MGFFNRVKQFFTGDGTRKAGQRKRLLNSPKSRKSVKKHNKTVKRKGLGVLPPVKPENNMMSYSAAYSPIALPEPGKKANKQKNLTKNKRNRNLNKIRGIKIGPAPPNAAPRVVVPKLAPPPSPTRRRGTRKSNQAKVAPVAAAAANTNLINFFSRVNTVKPVLSGPKLSRKELENLYAAEPKTLQGVFGTAGPSEPPSFDLPTRGWTREQNIKASRKFLNEFMKTSGPKDAIHPFNQIPIKPLNKDSSENPFNQFGPVPNKSKTKPKSYLQTQWNRYKRGPMPNDLQKKLEMAEQLQKALNAAKRRGYPVKDIKEIEEEVDRLGEELQV